jgi:hypothetical protein
MHETSRNRQPLICNYDLSTNGSLCTGSNLGGIRGVYFAKFHKVVVGFKGIFGTVSLDALASLFFLLSHTECIFRKRIHKRSFRIHFFTTDVKTKKKWLLQLLR